MDQPTSQLDYAPAPRWHQRRALKRWTIRAALLAAVLFSFFHWGPDAWNQLQTYRAQRQCLNYTPPQRQLIYADDPNPDPFARRDQNAFQQPAPACWTAIAANLPPPGALPPNPDPYYDSNFFPLAKAPAFLHQRDAGNHQRLVVVLFGGQSLGGKDHRVICCRVIQPATLLHRPRLLWEGSTIVISSFSWTNSARVYAGHPDPSDPAHFTLDIEGAGKIEGWLQADDTVKIEI